jgi:small conductance mechanosensitive channel
LFRVWTARSDWWATKLDLVQTCKQALEKGGITIPFPQRDVRLHAQPVDSVRP